MKFSEYQKKATKTAAYPEIGHYPVGVFYATLGLAGEAGEVAEEVKKSWRNDGKITSQRKMKILDEIGDVLWYAAQLSTELGLELEVAAQLNLKKLAKRAEKSEIQVHA